MAAFALIAKLQIMTFIMMVISDFMDHNTGQFDCLKNKLTDYFSVVRGREVVLHLALSFDVIM